MVNLLITVDDATMLTEIILSGKLAPESADPCYCKVFQYIIRPDITLLSDAETSKTRNLFTWIMIKFVCII